MVPCGDGDSDGATASPAGPAGTATSREGKGLLPLTEPRHSTASSLATQKIPHLNIGRSVNRDRTHFFKTCLALQNMRNFLRGPWFPHRHQTHTFPGQPSIRGPSHGLYHTAASALQSLGMVLACFVSGMTTWGQLHRAKTEALSYQQVGAARARP